MGLQHHLISSSFLLACAATIAGCGIGLDTDISKQANFPFLDTGFNGQGYVVHSGAGDSQGNAVAVDDSGNIYIAGFVTDTSRDFAVWKLRSDGTRDTTFGTSGLFTVDGGSAEDDEALALRIHDHSLIVSGYAKTGGLKHAVAVRLTLDGAYHGSWPALWNSGLPDTMAAGTSIHPANGNLVVVTNEMSAGDLRLHELNISDGSEVSAFVMGGTHQGASVLPHSGGNFLVSGSTNDEDEAFVARICWDGASFYYNDGGPPCSDNEGINGGGYRNFNLTAGADQIRALSLMPASGATWIAGAGFATHSRPRMTLWLLDWSGENIWPGGYVTFHQYEDVASKGHGVAVTDQGDILVAGYLGGTGTDATDSARDLAIWRYSKDGRIDETFGNGGVFTLETQEYGRDEGFAAHYDPAGGSLVVVGSSFSGTSDMTVWRFRVE